jgi:hypothetical protein
MRKERMACLFQRINYITRIRGAQDGLTCMWDVVCLAVEQLWSRSNTTRSAELDRHSLWRANLKVPRRDPMDRVDREYREVGRSGMKYLVVYEKSDTGWAHTLPTCPA